MNALHRILGKLFSSRTDKVTPDSLAVEGAMPEFSGLAGWQNSAPLSRESLRGKVVLVDFWTMSCVNCLRTIPHLKRWHETYCGLGLVIIGAHTPEFAFEKDAAAVESAIARFGISYPVALDNGYELWSSYKNSYWPAHYFIDRSGNIRYHHFGEGGYAHSEAVIRSLLEEAGVAIAFPPVETAEAGTDGPDFSRVRSPETYLGWKRQEYLGSPETVRHGSPQRYSTAAEPALNIFYFSGSWRIEDECAVPLESGARIVMRYDASVVNLVLAPTAGDGPGAAAGRLEVKLDGKPLSSALAGSDVRLEDGKAAVSVSEPRLYNLVDAGAAYGEHLLEVEFLAPGVRGYTFTFG